LPGECFGLEGSIPCNDRLQRIYDARADGIVETINARNAHFFDEELEKLERWADDLKSGLEFDLKERDREIKFLKTESRKILRLEEKLKAQREIKELEKKRNAKRRNLFEAQDEIERRKEDLIGEVEARLRQQIHREELFTIRWRVV